MTDNLYIIKHTYGEWEDSYTADLLVVKDEVVAQRVIDLLTNLCTQLDAASTSNPYFWQETVNWDDGHEVSCNEDFMILCCDIGRKLFFTSHVVPESLQSLVSVYSSNRYADGYFHYTPITVYKEFVE